MGEKYDRRFGEMRSELASLLERKKLELSEVTCSCCYELLQAPTRMQRCRHVLCSLCVENSVLYFRECPVCAAEMAHEPLIDIQHDDVMQMRLGTLRTVPGTLEMWRGRMEQTLRERERSLRMVLAFGMRQNEAQQWEYYVRAVPTTKQGIFIAGPAYEGLLPPEAIDQVVFGPAHPDANRSFSAPGPKKAKGARDFTPVPIKVEAQTLSGVASSNVPAKTGVTCDTFEYTFEPRSNAPISITVHWKAALWMAPIEIKFRPPSRKEGGGGEGGGRDGTFCCRLVVQFPATLGAARGAAQKASVTPRSTKKLSSGAVKKLKEVFDLIDADGQGTIDKDELIKRVHHLGMQLDVVEAVQVCPLNPAPFEIHRSTFVFKRAPPSRTTNHPIATCMLIRILS